MKGVPPLWWKEEEALPALGPVPSHLDKDDKKAVSAWQTREMKRQQKEREPDADYSKPLGSRWPKSKGGGFQKGMTNFEVRNAAANLLF